MKIHMPLLNSLETYYSTRLSANPFSSVRFTDPVCSFFMFVRCLHMLQPAQWALGDGGADDWAIRDSHAGHIRASCG